MPRSFLALERRATGDQRQGEQQEQVNHCQKQYVHRISRKDMAQRPLDESTKLGAQVEKHGSIYGRRCKGGIKERS
jgi:hypothetical protein